MRSRLFVILLLCSVSKAVLADDAIRFSLTEAVDYALKNNKEINASRMNISKAQDKVYETRGIGLPQLSASGDFRDNMKLPIFVFPNPMTGEQTPFKVGTKYSATGALQLNQLIFDGSYFVGLRAAKEYKELAVKLYEQDERDLKINVAKSYFLALISSENYTLINENLKTMSETLRETEGLYKEGFVENIDVDRLRLTVSNLEVQKTKVENSVEMTMMLLKAYMGIDVEQNIVLSDDLEYLNEKYLSQTPDLNGSESQRMELLIMKSQIALNKLDLDRYKVQRYPSVHGFANYQTQFVGDEMNFDPWYKSAIWGVSISVPIFSGGMSYYAIRQANASLKQSQLTYEHYANMMRLERLKAGKEFMISLNMLEVQKENFELAKKINETTIKKYQEGVGSNLEIVTANQDLKNAQTNYLEAIYDLLINKLNLQIANGESIAF